MICVKRFLVVTCAVLGFAGLAAPAFSGQATEVVLAPNAPPPSALVPIGPGDTLKVEFFNLPELTTTIGVGEDGSIRLSLVGSVIVAGMSTSDAGMKIEEAYKAGEYLVDPHVTVTVTQSVSQRVTVVGEVGNPGRYPIDPSTTVLDVLALAGGIGDKGWEVIDIVRHGAAGKEQRLSVDIRGIMTSGRGSPAANTGLQGGDTIVVKKGTFTITGEVKSPGEYKVEDDMVLFEALARAGDVTPLGSSSRIDIQRRDGSGKFVKVKAKKETRILPGDLIKVKERLF